DESRTPKTFDLIFTAGPEKGNRSLGIYELAKGGWKICLTTTASTRPKIFATKRGSGLALETLKRTAARKREKPEPADHRPYEPVAELEGEWTLLSLVRDGAPLEGSLLKYGKRVDRQNQVTVTFGPQVMFKAKYTVDAAARPKTIDFVPVQGPDKG